MSIGQNLRAIWKAHRRSILTMVVASLMLAGGLICLSFLPQDTPFFYQVY